jgi:hypothetical protein
MSTTTISKTFKVGGVATNPGTSIKIEVTNADGGAEVVAAGTDMTQADTGVYYHTFTDPAYDLTYDYTITIIHSGETYIFEGQQAGSTSTLGAVVVDGIDLTYISGSNLYAIIKDSNNYVYNATLALFELYDSANHTAGYYDIVLVDDDANGYTADWPALSDADYTVEIYEYITDATPDIEDSIVVSQTYTYANPALTRNTSVVMPIQFRYASLMEAEYYLTSRMNTDPWDDATGLQKVQSLIEATIIIERLAFSGKKTDEDQAYQFPRYDDDDTPQDVKDACTEIAYAILDGVDIEKEQDNLRVEFEAYADVKTAYNKQAKPHIQSGVPSRRAWDMLKPYLQPINYVTLSRID